MKGTVQGGGRGQENRSSGKKKELRARDKKVPGPRIESGEDGLRIEGGVDQHQPATQVSRTSLACGGEIHEGRPFIVVERTTFPSGREERGDVKTPEETKKEKRHGNPEEGHKA